MRGIINVIKFSTLLSSRPQLKSSLFEVKLANETLFAHKVFDSRPPSFLAPKKEQSHLLQSFYGLKIKTTSKGFDSSTIVMMDFNVPQNNSTQFIYVLPYTEDTALVELTRFGSEKLEVKDAEIILNNYLKESSFTYTVIEDERGVIPMSSAQIEIDDFGENWIPMGARANMLKPTTGYAFHAMAEDAVTHVESITLHQFNKLSNTNYICCF